MRISAFLYSALGVAATMLTGCTISFQNVSTHGPATDLIDEIQTATSDASPDLELSPV